MKFPFFFGVVACLAAGCASKRDVSSSSTPIALDLAFQSNRSGSMEPCGCQSKPYGGMDRELNALETLLSKGRDVLYVDAGNLLAPVDRKTTLGQGRAKAVALWQMERLLNLSVFAPGPADFSLGEEFLQVLADTADDALFVSTNVVDVEGNPLFSPFQVREVSGVRVAFLSATPPMTYLRSVPAVDALKRWLPEAAKRADIVVVLSQLGAKEDEKLLENFPGVHLVVGADPTLALERPLWFSGGRLLVDPAVEGTYLGHLALRVTLPFQGFSSDGAVAEAKAKQTYWKSRENVPGKSALAKRELRRLEAQEPLAAIPRGTEYRYELIGLDAERFGKPNRITKLRAEEKERVRTEALAE